MITIHNLKHEKMEHPYDILIDRRSMWGNPFPMKNKSLKERERVCHKYDVFFHEHFKNEYSDKLERLKAVHQQYGKLRLFCWCTPLQCHGQVIKNYLED